MRHFWATLYVHQWIVLAIKYSSTPAMRRRLLLSSVYSPFINIYIHITVTIYGQTTVHLTPVASNQDIDGLYGSRFAAGEP